MGRFFDSIILVDAIDAFTYYWSNICLLTKLHGGIDNMQIAHQDARRQYLWGVKFTMGIAVPYHWSPFIMWE